MERPCAQRRGSPCLDRRVSRDWGSKGYELTSNNNHINDVDNAGMLESFKDLDFSKGSDRHPFLLVVHENPL